MNDLLTVGVCSGSGVYRAGMMTVLRGVPGIDVVVEFDTAGYSPRLLRDRRPRVLLMDLDGFDIDDLLARQVVSRTTEQAVKVLALSSHLDPDTAIKVLRGGAEGFLHKDTPVRGLVDAIRAVDRGGAALDPQVAGELVTALRYSGPSEASVGLGSGVKLTPRQRQILGLIGHGLTNVEIADQLQLGRPTVKSHISSLLRALDLRDRTQLAVYACTHGFRAHAAVPVN
ncbi:response regulator transcription factor [Streptomyces sp. NK08204]|uniref:LuxR C-terminal-related transcriptional regulator n=1 Tax=Streptomyces sp. NK08204 TaxID=2873260 RepID=UPI001CED6C1F|nr:response regulator transcription factor [Streptomyces sp. NK08204]